MPLRNPIGSNILASFAGRILFPVCLLAPAGVMADDDPARQYPRPAQTVDSKEKQDLCPVRWGKRPRRSNGPGAERYVAEWGPCKPGASVVPASLNNPPVQPRLVR